MGLLEGVRILDFSRILAGPMITLLLGHMGAQIVRVESRNYLEVFRLGPGVSTSIWGTKKAAAILFNHLNLNKLSVTINLKHEKGIKIAKKLISISDVIVDNFAAGTMDKLGIGYPMVREIKPDIIMLSASGHGATGPERHYVGYAALFGPLSGISYLTGYGDSGPAEIRNAADTRVGPIAATAILAALIHRQRTGQGQYIDLSSRETMTCYIGEAIIDYLMNGRIQGRVGNSHDFMAPHNCYRCRGEDRWVSIAIATDKEWQSFCDAMGNPQWTEDERFIDQLGRYKNQEELDHLIETWTCCRENYEVMDILQKYGIGAMPSFSNKDSCQDAHLKQRQYFVEIEHHELGKQVVLAPPWKLSAMPQEIIQPAPLLGEHTDYVLSQFLGLSPDEISEFRSSGALD